MADETLELSSGGYDDSELEVVKRWLVGGLREASAQAAERQRAKKLALLGGGSKHPAEDVTEEP